MSRTRSIAALLVAGLFVSGCWGSRSDPTSTRQSGSVRPGELKQFHRYVFRASGIVLRYPSSWFVSTEPLNGIINPVQRFVLSSYRVPIGRPDFDGNYAPPPRGLIAQLVEEVPPLNNGGLWPMRPRHFRLGRLGRMEGFGGNRWAEVRFRDHGRRFYLFIGIGRAASSAQIGLLLRRLDGIRITAQR